MQTWDICYIDAVQCKSATESHRLARWSQAGVCFLWDHVLAVCWHPLAHAGWFIAAARAGKKTHAPELMVINSGHPAPQVSCRSLASRLTSRDMSLITLITVARNCQGRLSVVVPGFAVWAQPCRFSGSDLNDTQKAAGGWDGEREEKIWSTCRRTTMPKFGSCVMMLSWSPTALLGRNRGSKETLELRITVFMLVVGPMDSRARCLEVSEEQITLGGFENQHQNFLAVWFR